MKKQILVLSLAIFAMGIQNSYAQKAVHDSDPNTTAGCSDDPLHPIAGKSYNYKAVVNPTGGNFLWWATKDINFITNQTTNNSSTKLTVGSGLTAAGTSYGQTSSTGDVDITWSSTTLANTGYQGAGGKTPTFVVVQYDAPTSGCSNNLKVYELDPKNGFIVDIKNINNTSFTAVSYGTKESQCIDKVSKATYNAGKVEYEYGTNSFYYEIVAANFSESWTPTFDLSGLNSAQTSVIEWSYDKPSASTTWNSYVSGTTVFETNATDTSNGVSVYIKVTITNHNYEGKGDLDLTLAVDGQNKDGIWDIKNADCTDPKAADKDDKAVQTLKARPDITAGTTSTITPNIDLIPTNAVN